MKKITHFFSLKRYGNCLLFLLYLYFTGRIHTILLRTSRNGTWFWHWLGITNKGNIIHLTNRKIKGKTDLTPIFFYGQPEVFHKRFLRRANYEVIVGNFCWDDYDGI